MNFQETIEHQSLYNGNPVLAKYRKRGPEKNHRPDLIVEMEPLMGRKGIPLAFDLLLGNESEKGHVEIGANVFSLNIDVVFSKRMK